jgi:hypothetical protein
MGLLGAEIQDMSVDQLAGAIVLVLGAIGSLLLVIWQSRCACRCRIGLSEKCYIFDCSREPPTDEERKKKEEEEKAKKKKEEEEKEKAKKKDKSDDKAEVEEEDVVIVPKEPSELEYVSDPIPDLENPKP